MVLCMALLLAFPTTRDDLERVFLMTRYLLTTAMIGLAAGISLGADIESGLAPGKSMSPFNVLNVNGPAAGESNCQI